MFHQGRTQFPLPTTNLIIPVETNGNGSRPNRHGQSRKTIEKHATREEITQHLKRENHRWLFIIPKKLIIKGIHGETSTRNNSLVKIASRVNSHPTGQPTFVFVLVLNSLKYQRSQR